MGEKQNRVRRFSFGILGEEAINLWRYLEIEALEAHGWEYAVTARGAFAPGARRRGDMPRPNGPSWTTVRSSIEQQGLPTDFLARFVKETPLTATGAQRMIGNGVPLPTGRAIAKAVKEAIEALP
jgi:site-specific DNA-cytosine methylase